MKFRSSLLAALLVILGCIGAQRAPAAPIYFIGGDGLGMTAAAAEAAFQLAAGSTAVGEEFEGETVGTQTGNGPLSNFFAGSNIQADAEQATGGASGSPQGGVWVSADGVNSFGLLTPDGDRALGWRNIGGASPNFTGGSLTLTLPTAATAFAMDIIDFGDTVDAIPPPSTWELNVQVDANTVQQIATSSTASPRGDNNVIFFGVVDATPFTTLLFNNTGFGDFVGDPGDDVTAYDRIQLNASTPPPSGGAIPEPSTLVIGLVLAACALYSRRRHVA